MLNAIIGAKVDTSQRFTQDGKRIPVTRIKAGPCYVVQIKSKEKDGYNAIQLGWGEKKLTRVNKPLKGHLKGAKLDKAPFWLVEVGVEEVSGFKLGEQIRLTDVFKAGDRVKITGWSKGKGFTGVVKRWGFAGGPRTHGQSDRERAPGSIGQTTTPGRVFKGKKMAGRAGGKRVTISGLTIMEVDPQKSLLLVKGLVPGPKKGKLIIKKIGEEKKFVSLLKPGEKEIKEAKEEKTERLKKEKEAKEKLKEVKEEKTASGEAKKPDSQKGQENA